MICEKKDCTGCHACFNICPKKAISMEEDELGFIFPVIDESKCINCNMCKKVCPSLLKPVLNTPRNCFAMQVKNEIKLEQSTSGGAATIISENYIRNGGIVYGCAFEKGFKIHHIRVDNLYSLYKLRGSKYVHSYIEDTFKKIKEDLKNQKKVLFIGTPCQVAGLKKYMIREYESLYTIDIICHGVPSQKYLKDDLLYSINQDTLMNCDNMQFRSNKGYYIQLKSKDKVVYESSMEDSMYYYGFMKSIFNRDNCYNCKFANSKRVSDLTIGDFWGLGEDSVFYHSRNKGVSLLLPVSDKGNELLELSKNDIILESRMIEEAINGNDQLKGPSIRKKRYKRFNNLYKKYGFKKAFRSVTIDKRIKKILKKNRLIMIAIKKIKG